MSNSTSVKSNQVLDAKLAAYSPLPNKDGGTAMRRKRSWAVYAAVAGSSLAMSTAAEAAVVHGTVNMTATLGGVPGNHTTANWDGSANVPFAIDGDSFKGEVQHYLTGGFYTNAIAALIGIGNDLVMDVTGGPTVSGRAPLKFLASGANISSAAGVFHPGGTLNLKNSTVNRGVWPAGSTGFAGIALNTGSGNIHFGWVRLEWNKSTAAAYPNSIKVVDWAYSTVTGESVTAGELPATSTPEPASGMLALLAAGTIALRKWRKSSTSKATVEN